MLTQEQEQWVNHLSNENTITIVPFDATAEQQFQVIKRKIQKKLGTDVPVEHHGASSMGISGQDEIDVDIPVAPGILPTLIAPLKEMFGEPGSEYPGERVRFRTEVEGKRIDIFLWNNEHENWLIGMRFEGYLRTHPEALEEYRQSKESGNGLTVREYYRRKNEFINEILKLAQ